MRLKGTSGDHLVYPPCLKRRHVDQVAQGHVHLGFKYIQEWRLHNFSVQPIPVFSNLRSKSRAQLSPPFCKSFCLSPYGDHCPACQRAHFGFRLISRFSLRISNSCCRTNTIAMLSPRPILQLNSQPEMLSSFSLSNRDIYVRVFLLKSSLPMLACPFLWLS